MEKIWLKNYEEGVAHEVDYPDLTFYDILENNVKEDPEKAAFSFFGKVINYTLLKDYVDQFASALYELGVRKGTRVAIMLPNVPQYPIVHYAVIKLGGIIVPTNPLYVEREIEHQMNNSGAEYIIVLNLMFNRVKKVWKNTRLKKIIVTGVKEYLPGLLKLLYPLKEKKEGTFVKVEPEENVLFFQDLMKASYPNAQKAAMVLDDVAIFLYTGGTTGVSKGAVLTHRNIVANVFQITGWLTDLKVGGEIVLSAIPFFHSYGMTTCLHFCMATKSVAILLPRFDVKMVLQNIQKSKATIFPGVPTMYVAINNYAEIDKFDLSSIRSCLSGGAALLVEVQRKFEKISGGRLVEGYGLSETSPVVHATPIYGNRKEGSMGIPVSSTEAAIVDNETMEEKPIGEIGELAVKGPQIMKEYWQMPEETKAALKDGWFLTGDMAKMDEDGFFYIVDRKKDMIIASGFNIYPREVEEVLFQHPKIAEAAVAGVPDEYRGETVKAFIILKEGESATAEEIIEFCTDKLAKFKVPKFIEFRTELPKSLIGKVLRRVLIEEEKKKSEENKK